MAKQLQIETYSALPSGEKGDLLHSVQRALRVLNLIAEHPQGLSARDISNALCLNISTCYHILNTLVASGYLDRHPHSQVYLEGLNDIMRQGYSIDREEFSTDIYCIAAPVFGPQGQVVAALAISLTPASLARHTEWLITQVTRAANYARAELRLSSVYH